MIPVPAPLRCRALLPFAAALALSSAAPAAPESSSPTTSTIHGAIQESARQALERRVRETNARRGAAIVLDVATGDILALAAATSAETTAPARKYALTDALEPGSVLQTFAFAAALEEGLATPETVIDCGDGRYEFNGRVIRDVHPLGEATVREVFSQSSNIGAVKLTQKLSPATLRARLAAFGFGTPTSIALPGEAAGLLRPTGRWSSLSMSSIPLGYEMTATAVQLAAAMAALANNGLYMEPRLTRPAGESAPPEPQRRVVCPETCSMMLGLLREVVEKGTGKSAAPEGWSAAGKTGTTKKLDPVAKKYSMKNYVASFCGVAPAGKPRVAICVWVDEPKNGNFYGGAVAAPVFREIATAALTELGVPREGN